MRATEFLSEVFTSNVPGQLVRATPDLYTTKAMIGGRTIVFNSSQYDDDEGKSVWEIDFTEYEKNGTGTTFAKTGSGGELQVFSFVIESIKDLIARYHPDQLTFTSHKADENRTKLYQRMLNRIKVPGYHAAPLEFGEYDDYFKIVKDDLDEGWKEKAAAGALALGALGAHGDAQAKEKETWIQPRQQAVRTTMSPAAKFDSTKIRAKAPVAKAPVANAPAAPIAKAPVGSTKVDPSAMNILSLHNPEAEEVLHRTAKAAGLKGTELAQFMAQTRHESADFSRMKELGGDKYFNKLYDPKTSPRTAKILGNTKVGDGIRYHGRGFIQITGRDNYRMAGEALNMPLEKHPELASKPAIAAKIAVWYWKTRVKPFVQNFADTASVTKKINPAMRGLQDRHEYFQDYRKII